MASGVTVTCLTVNQVIGVQIPACQPMTKILSTDIVVTMQHDEDIHRAKIPSWWLPNNFMELDHTTQLYWITRAHDEGAFYWESVGQNEQNTQRHP